MEQREIHMDDIIEDIKLFLPKLVQACESVGELFYEPMTEQTWQQFGDVVEGMDDLYKTLGSINAEMNEGNGFNVLQTSIVRVINGLNDKFQAMNFCIDVEDYIGASDYIKYELIPLFRQLAVELGEERNVTDQRFAANMAYLQQKYSKLHAQISSITRDPYQYQIVYARNAMPNICMVSDQKELAYLYSQYDPEYAAKRWVETIADKVENKSSIILYGFALGYHALSYAAAYPEHRLYIYEPDEQLLLAAMSVIDIRELFDQLNVADFVVGTKKAERDKMFFRFLKYMKGEPEIIALPIYDKIKTVNKNEFSNDAQIAILNYDSSIRMYEKYGMEWVTNSMYNLAKTLSTPSILNLKNKLAGTTAVIVGAGPSLEADIECLRKLKNHAFIIAAGSTIQSLLHFGIDPHLIVSMDGTNINFDAFKDLEIKSIPLLYTPMINYSIIDKKNENLFHVHFINDAPTKHFMGLTEEDPIFQSNHSVTGTAIQAAIYMGCKEIVFTGQDLSFPNENMYSPGARHLPKKKNDSIIGGAELTVENVRGTTNRTNYPMSLTLADIETLTVRHSTAVRFINTTQMGAKIKQTVWQPMEEVLIRLHDKRLEDDFFIKELANLMKYDEQRINKVCEHIAQLPDQMLLIEERLKRIDYNIGKLSELSRMNPKKCFAMFGAIEADWKTVVDSSPFKAFYFMVFKNDLNQFERDLPELANESNMIKKAGLAREIMQPLVKELIDRTPELLKIVRESKRRIEAGMGETIAEVSS